MSLSFRSKNNKGIVPYSLIFYYCALWIFLVYFPDVYKVGVVISSNYSRILYCF
ncbi:hypothetical protein BD770DRAFT_391552 [Pilaira anomala]|nr:hypothetical protein BD770DRAFT_391552 [Pilaira anomala]